MTTETIEHGWHLVYADPEHTWHRCNEMAEGRIPEFVREDEFDGEAEFDGEVLFLAGIVDLPPAHPRGRCPVCSYKLDFRP